MGTGPCERRAPVQFEKQTGSVQISSTCTHTLSISHKTFHHLTGELSCERRTFGYSLPNEHPSSGNDRQHTILSLPDRRADRESTQGNNSHFPLPWKHYPEAIKTFFNLHNDTLQCVIKMKPKVMADKTREYHATGQSKVCLKPVRLAPAPITTTIVRVPEPPQTTHSNSMLLNILANHCYLTRKTTQSLNLSFWLLSAQ